MRPHRHPSAGWDLSEVQAPLASFAEAPAFAGATHWMPRQKKNLVAALLLLLPGCVPTASVPADTAAIGQMSASACAKAGGAIRPVGRMQTMQCVLAYSDAGKSCTSGDQCLGDCRVRDLEGSVAGKPAAGICQATSDRFGCHARVERGLAQSAICID